MLKEKHDKTYIHHASFIKNGTVAGDRAIKHLRLACGSGIDLIVQPPSNSGAFPIQRPTVLYTTWDSQTVDPVYVKWLNQMEHIFVMCQWIKDIFLAAGVWAPMEVLQMNYRPEYYVKSNQKDKSLVRFGLAGQTFDETCDKKNILKGIEAFKLAFPSESDVELKVKIPGTSYFDSVITDPRITFVKETWSHEQMADWYRALSCFMHISMCEGFGVMPVEAMACGVPIMSTNFSGMGEYTSTPYYNLGYDLVKKNSELYPNTTWADPKMSDIISKMHEIYRNRTEAHNRGMIASEYVKKFHWDKFKDRLWMAMENFV